MDLVREIYVQVGFLINRRCVGVDCVSYLTGLCGGYANKRIIMHCWGKAYAKFYSKQCTKMHEACGSDLRKRQGRFYPSFYLLL